MLGSRRGDEWFAAARRLRVRRASGRSAACRQTWESAPRYATPGVLYEPPVGALRLELGVDFCLDVSDVLTSGRTNYPCSSVWSPGAPGMRANSEGAASDLRDAAGASVEVKAFYDAQVYPSTADRFEVVHTAASSTFGPNNHGPVVKAALAGGDYATAWQVCWDTGFSKNDLLTTAGAVAA